MTFAEYITPLITTSEALATFLPHNARDVIDALYFSLDPAEETPNTIGKFEYFWKQLDKKALFDFVAVASREYTGGQWNYTTIRESNMLFTAIHTLMNSLQLSATVTQRREVRLSIEQYLEDKEHGGYRNFEV